MLELLLVGTLTGAVLVLIAGAIGHASSRNRPFGRPAAQSASVVMLDVSRGQHPVLDDVEETKKAA